MAPSGFQNLIPNRLFLGRRLPRRKESTCISRCSFLRRVADLSQGMSTTRFDTGLWENEDVRSAESWEEAERQPSKPAARWFPGNWRTHGFLYLPTVRLRGIPPTHQHSRGTRSGQVHSCRTRRRHSWENKCTGQLKCTQRRRHRRHHRSTLEGEKYKYCKHPMKCTNKNKHLRAVSPVLTLTVGEGVVSWLAAVTSRTCDTPTAQTPSRGITNGLHCPSVVTWALCGHTRTHCI